MRRVLQTDAGKALYQKRSALIEPVFGQTKFNRRIDCSFAAEDRRAGRNGA